jgi:hypothetical protein
MNFSVANIVVSTATYFAVAHVVKRAFDEMEIPRGMTRSTLIFALAIAAAYGAAALIDVIAG